MSSSRHRFPAREQPLEHDSAIPLYHQLAARLRDELLLGGLDAGGRYHSDQELARRFAISHLTVRQGVATLVAEGLLERRQGSGTFVTAAVAQRREQERTVGGSGALLFTGWDLAALSGWSAMYFRDVYAGLSEAAAAHGLRLMVDDPAALPRAGLADAAKRHGLRGVIALEGDHARERAEAFAAAGMRVVTVNCQVAGVPAVMPDDQAGIGLAVAHLHGLGHRRLVHLNSGEAAPHWREVRRGYESALAAAGLTLSANPVLISARGCGSIEAGEELAAQALARPQPPTALVAGNDLMAIGALKHLRAHGIAVPQRISVTGYDDIEAAQICAPALTTVAVDRAGLGRTAVGLVLAGESATGITRQPVSLCLRESTGPVAKGSDGTRAGRGRRRTALATALAFAVALLPSALSAAAGDGADLAFGGAGSGDGQFCEVRQLVFDAKNDLYVLEGVRSEKSGRTGNSRVQKFDRSGKLLTKFPITVSDKPEANDPTRLAVDGAGNVYVTQPQLDQVQCYAPDGHLLRTIAVPQAYAITRWTMAGRERIAVVGNRRGSGGKQPAWLGGDQVFVIAPDGNLEAPVKLGKAVNQCGNLCADRQGNLYLLAAENQIYKYDASGKFLLSIGAGTNTRVEDGSEALHSVAVDSVGNIFTMTWGNPGWVVKYDPQVTTVVQRVGEYRWADPWSVHSCYTPLAIDGDDRLWVATTTTQDPKGPNFAYYHASPTVLRTQADFLATGSGHVTEKSALLLGLSPAIVSKAPYDIAYDLAPFAVDFVVKAGNRRVSGVTVEWRVEDMLKRDAGHGRFELALSDGVEARQALSFTPPRFGWYAVTCTLYQGTQRLTSIAHHVAVTPRFPGMAALAEGDSKGGWEDIARQAFCGMMIARVHPAKGLDKLDQAVAEAAKYGVTLLAQFSDRKECTEDNVRAVVTRFAGKIKYWEVMNEPNLSMKTEEYAALLKLLRPVIRSCDPQAQVLGPAVCGINLGWIEAIYKLGGKDGFDILSVHDYEGHESIDPEHWRWKFGALRELMAKYGDKDKPIWQTERAISGVRGVNFLGPAQAVRVALHHDLLETFGIPDNHNCLYYLNDSGYSAVPSYLWSASGPHPGALVLRTRQALVGGRTFAGEIDLGPDGNKLFLALRFTGGDGDLLALRNLGGPDEKLEATVHGGDELRTVDAFGNETIVAVRGGKATLTIAQLPLYVRLAKGQRVELPRLDLGRNYAPEATVSYSAPTKTDPSLLSNGVFETIHAGNPHGDTGHPPIWIGALPSLPQTLDLALPRARAIDAVFVHGLHADNGFCALLDYDLQAQVGGAWTTLAEVRAACPPSDQVDTTACSFRDWCLDDNRVLSRFAPVVTDRLRLVVKRTTWGFVADGIPTAWSDRIPPQFMLREIEIHGPAQPVTVAARLDGAAAASGFAPVTFTVANRGERPLQGKISLQLPTGWQAQPAEVPAAVAAGATFAGSFTLVPPAEFPTGDLPIGVLLADGKGAIIDSAQVRLAIPSLVDLSAQVPAPGQADATLRLVVRNRTDQPLGGVARCVFDRSDAGGKSHEFGPVAPKQSVTLEFAVAGLGQPSGPHGASFIVTANHRVTTLSQDLVRRTWQVVGTFAPEFDKDFGPEKSIDLTAGYTNQMGEVMRWRTVAGEQSGLVNLQPLFQPNTNVCAYAAIWVKSPTARSALFSAGSDDCGKGWLNGRLVMTDKNVHGAAPGQIQVPVELKAGWNEVLLKIMQSNGGWGFYFDLLTPDGKPIADLVYSAKRGE